MPHAALAGRQGVVMIGFVSRQGIQAKATWLPSIGTMGLLLSVRYLPL